MLLGNRLKTLRKEKSLTQAELGKLINVTKVSISCYENDNRVPTLETIIALTRVFNVDINYFLGNDYYVIADNDSSYTITVAKEEMIFLEELKKHDNLYKKVIEDPKRCVELIDKKVR